MDAAEVKPEMTDRFEYELDTTRPVEAWQKEVAANLSRKAAAATIELVDGAGGRAGP